MAANNQALTAPLPSDPSGAGGFSTLAAERRLVVRAVPLVVTRVALDALAVGAATALAFPLRFRWHALEATPGPLDGRAHLTVAALWLLGVLGPMASHRLYDEDTLAPGGGEMTRIRRSLLEGVAVVSTAVFVLRLVSVSRGWFFFVIALTALLLSAERRAARAVLTRFRATGHMRRPAVLVTIDDADANDIAGSEFDVVATVRPDGLAAVVGADGGRRGKEGPVVIIGAVLDRDVLWRLVMQAGDAGCAVFLLSPFRPLPADRLTTRGLGERTIVKVSPPAITGVRAFEKRVLDVVVAAVAFSLLAVPMAIIGLAVLVTSGRPIFYGQQRVGRNGRPFTMWKFRTMRRDAEADAGPVWATAEDPRRTTIGSFLRRSSLDELPQLWNVLRGHMSIVGPRPERPVFVARFDEDNPWYRFRHRIRPGITGMAQVSGLRGDTPVAPRVESDNWYIENWSLGLDLRIAARTFVAMLRGRNAH